MSSAITLTGDNGWPFPRCKANLYDGGTRQPLYEGADRKWTDLSPSTKPAYHYLELRRENHTLVAIVRGLNEDFRGFEDTARLRIEGPPGVEPPGR